MDANGMIMRHMLLRNVLGISTYTYHAIEVAKTLKATAQGKTPFDIKDEQKLLEVARFLEIKTLDNIEETALSVADFILQEINRDSDEPSRMVEILAPEARKKLRRKLGIFPGGLIHHKNESGEVVKREIKLKDAGGVLPRFKFFKGKSLNTKRWLINSIGREAHEVDPRHKSLFKAFTHSTTVYCHDHRGAAILSVGCGLLHFPRHQRSRKRHHNHNQGDVFPPRHHFFQCHPS